jgi:hypothetical protein
LPYSYATTETSLILSAANSSSRRRRRSEAANESDNLDERWSPLDSARQRHRDAAAITLRELDGQSQGDCTGPETRASGTVRDGAQSVTRAATAAASVEPQPRHRKATKAASLSCTTSHLAAAAAHSSERPVNRATTTSGGWLNSATQPNSRAPPIAAVAATAATTLVATAMQRNPAEVAFFRLLHDEFHKAVYFIGATESEFALREERLQHGIEIYQRQEQAWSTSMSSLNRGVRQTQPPRRQWHRAGPVRPEQRKMPLSHWRVHLHRFHYLVAPTAPLLRQIRRRALC